MRKNLVALAIATLLASVPAAAFADGTATGAAGGAITGAIVGGPVGAAVGGVIGAVIGTVIEPPPPPVVSYVAAAPAPPPIALQGNLVVGATLPPTVMLQPVPPEIYLPADGRVYAFAIVNGQRVIVDPYTRVVVAFVS